MLFISKRNQRPSLGSKEPNSERQCIIGDVSESMYDVGFKRRVSKRRLVYEACLRFLEIKKRERPQDQVGVVAYGNKGYLCSPFLRVGNGYDGLVAALKKLRKISGGGTRLVSGLEIALELICAADESQGMRAPTRILTYSDGADASKEPAILCAEELKRAGVLIETFGVGRNPQDVDEVFLREIATVDNTGFVHYRFLGDDDAVRLTFEKLARGRLTIET